MEKRIVVGWLCLACTGLSAQDEPAVTTEAPAPRESFGGAMPWQWTRLTGDWFGLRDTLEDSGIEIAGGYTSDFTAPWSGNVARRS